MNKIKNKMSQRDRAKQFAPFAALKGHDRALKQYGAFKEDRIELAEEEAEAVNNILVNLQKGDNVIVTYYMDSCYTILSGCVQKVFEYEHQLQIENHRINFHDIYRIQKREV